MGLLLAALMCGFLVRSSSAIAAPSSSSEVLSPQHARSCDESQMCSVGISKPWSGDIRDSDQFRAFLESVTYKKELIITMFAKQESPPYSRVDEILQYHYELMDMGYAHHAILVVDGDECQQIQVPTLSCIWDSDKVPKLLQDGLWAGVSARWKLMARTIRLGYNVMATDTDYLFFSDPYIHLKAPPLQHVNMFCNPERGNFYCNAGFIYVQNVRPDGPIAWLWMEYVRMTRRLGDDNYEFISQWNNGARQNCFPDEQDQIEAAASTAVVGRPAYFRIIDLCKRNASLVTRTGITITGRQAGQLAQDLVYGDTMRMQTVHAPPSQAWLDSKGLYKLPETDCKLLIANMTVPNMAYGFPEELGGSIFPPGPPGPYSTSWEQQLRSDCPSCPWWPEVRPLPEGGDPLAQLMNARFDKVFMNATNKDIFWDPNIPTESFSHPPSWLSSSLKVTRRGTVLGKNAPRQGFMVGGHVHIWHYQSCRDHKIMLRKIYGRYNYTVGQQVAETGHLASPYSVGTQVTHVLALSPSLDLSRTRTPQEFATILLGLFQVAYLSHRTVLLPDIPCQTSWAHSKWVQRSPDHNTRVCVAPAFYDMGEHWPMPVPVAVDSQGELVGGWARRLQAWLRENPSATTNDITEQNQTPVELLFPWHAVKKRPGRQDAAGDGSARTRGRSLRYGGVSSRLADEWWAQLRFVLMLPELWDPACSRDMKGLISPEFHHWRKHDPHAVGLDLQPGPSNTVFLPQPQEAALRLQPPSPPGGDSAAVPPGSLVMASDEPGWSLSDVQATLPAAEVVQAMKQVEQVPLVYLGHPVTVVGSGVFNLQRAAAALGVRITLTPDKQAGPPKGHAVPVTETHSKDPDTMLAHANNIIQASHCKALWENPQMHSEGTVVGLTHGLPGKVVGLDIALAGADP